MPKWTIIIVFLLLLLSRSYATEINYSRSAELPALRVSFADLQKILNKPTSLMATANITGKSQSRTEELSLYKRNQRITLSGHILNAEGARLPETVDRLEYIVREEDPHARVRRIELSLSDNYRDLKVEGSSADQVDAVFSSLKDDLLDISSAMGGYNFRPILMFVLSFGTGCYIFIILGNWIIEKKRLAVAPLAFSVITLILAWTLPFNEIFAGFSALKGDASLMVRYGPHISFLGLVFSIAGIPVSYWLTKAKTRESK